MRVLITRDAEGAQPYADPISARGGEVVYCPVSTVHFLSPTLPENYKTLVFTSRHGIRQFCNLSSDRKTPIYVVGPQSAEAARAAGFQTIHEGAGTAADMARMIPRSAAPVLYGRGKDIAHSLEIEGEIHEAILYEARAVSQLSDFNAPDLALFFSVRGAEIFCDLVQKQGLMGKLAGTKALCLGAGMVGSLSAVPWCDIQVAKRPDRAAFLALIDDYI